MRADMNLLGNKRCAAMVVAVTILLLAGNSAFADFLVQPIILKKQVYPGKRIPLEFKVENLGSDTTEEVSLRLTDLTQDVTGMWREVVPEDPNETVDVSKLRSCKSWLTLLVASVTVDPSQNATVDIVATIPGGTRGYYFAALVAETKPREVTLSGRTALVGLRYIVPIILEAQASPLQHQIELTDLGLMFKRATLQDPTSAVLASMNVTNKGGTYSRLHGLVKVFQASGNNWKRIADIELPTSGIIPGVSLSLTKDVGTLLPSGRYKMEGYLYVDGRRGSAVQKEFDFEGDRRVLDPQTLTPIDLDKDTLFISALPGLVRGGSLLLTNGSEDPVTVNVEFVSPPHMRNLISGRQVRGDDLSCADWGEVRPSEFTLQRYTRRNVNVVVKMPAGATQYSNYYGLLRFHVTYADGSSAGVKEVNVCLSNEKAPVKNEIDADLFSLSEATPGRYIATSTFSNGGVTYIRPRCRGVVTGPGDAKIFQCLMEATGQESVFLPFQKRTFSGVVDTTTIPVGIYRLTAVLEYEAGRDKQDQPIYENAQNQLVIEVYEQGGQKAARIAGWDQTPDGKVGRTTIRL